jgi:cation transport ATPase
MSTSNKPSTGFWIISVIALIWNGIGVMQYLGGAFMKEEIMAQLTPEQAELYGNMPAWVTAAFAVAVFAGLLGCIALLLRKKMANMLFVLSLLGILVQMSYSLFMTNFSEVYGTFQGVVMPVLVILIGLFLVRFSKNATAKGWLS